MRKKRSVRVRELTREATRRILGDSGLESVQVATTELILRVGRRRSYDHTAVRALVQSRGPSVQAGPFSGLRYGQLAIRFGANAGAKLLGTYECELHETIRRVLDPDPPLVVVVGAADGYYAVGLAQVSGRRVLAYEANPYARRLCRETARENRLSHMIELRGECSASALLREELPPGTLVLLDCEGCENNVADPNRVPSLTRAVLVVELHDFLVPGTSERVIARLQATHDVKVISARSRFPVACPTLMELPGLNEVQRELAVNELRPAPMQWAVFTPRRRSRE